MSLGGRIMMGAEAYQVVPVACLPPQFPHQLAMACLTRQPNSHTSWAAPNTAPYGGFHPPYQGPYSPVPNLTAPPALIQKRPASGSPPVSKKCPSVPLPQLSRTSFHVGYYVPPSVEPGDLYGGPRRDGACWLPQQPPRCSGCRSCSAVLCRCHPAGVSRQRGEAGLLPAPLLGLEEVWNQHFELLFRNLPHMWSFGPAETAPSDWHVFKDMAKVRFSCQHCAHGWTSMHGLVVFYYRWDATSNQGLVRFLLTGQKCNQCDVEDFETPMWYPEEAQKVMTNLYHEVAGRIYKLQTPPLIKDRRHGRPRQQHNATMCQGCRQGLCKTNKTMQICPSRGCD
ncbi:Receptor-transporting protein 3 [Chionoecetes opilio]|uniref:Receptor-transporting protein 3 n=1 Tax=Chionoecetes opilio TaxID=41210 RepID=A0A8J5D3L0_CHIOP|nr:Receptor-transporting protein 3 [Chionoecetes opilio]